MAVFTAAAVFFAGAATAIGFSAATAATIGAFAVRTLVTIGISKLIGNRANKTAAGANDVGSRVQLGPATNNKLAPSYGSAFLAPTVTDAKITTDQKTMYYVFTLCEATSGTMSFGKIFWNGKEVTLGAGDYSANNKVVSLTNNATPPQVDDSINGNAWIYQFSNGSSSGVNTGGTTAITILQDAGIPVADRWTSTDVMSDTCFIIVKVNYNRDVQDATSMPRLSIQVTNTLTKPGMVLKDYMTNQIYGCAIDLANIDEPSLDALDTYSDETITYVPVGGGSITQPRYRVNGPVNTGDSCLNNLQQLIDTCDSWIQYSELTGKWKVVINKPYTGSTGDLYHVDSSVLIGGIDINPLDLNQTYNSLEVQYPDANINDQTNYKVVDMTTSGTAWYDPTLLSPNEPDNRIVVQFPQVNNYVQAVYLGVRRLLQTREDLIITCQLDYSGIQIEAGDVVRVTLAEYGWTDKLFRVSQVQETKTGDGFLGARITAFEYNATIYSDNAIQDYVPEANTGLTDPNIFDTPTTPVVLNGPVANGAINYFTVSSNVPAIGTTLYMDFNVGNSSNLQTHKSYSSVQVGDGTPYTANSTITINVADLNPNTYYWSATARNDFAGKQSNSSTGFVWGGPSVSTFDGNSNIGGIGYNNMGLGTGGKNRIAYYSYSIGNPVANTVTLPVNITSFGSNVKSANYDAPKFIIGTDVNANYYFPYYQGTSTTANGYLANSTSQYNPGRATQFIDVSGTDNWWAMEYELLSTIVQSFENFEITLETNIVSNANTIIQLAPMLTFTSGINMAFATDDALLTVPLTANLPVYLNIVAITAGSSTIDGAGLAIRNMVANTQVDIARSTFSAYRIKQ